MTNKMDRVRTLNNDLRIGVSLKTVLEIEEYINSVSSLSLESVKKECVLGAFTFMRAAISHLDKCAINDVNSCVRIINCCLTAVRFLGSEKEKSSLLKTYYRPLLEKSSKRELFQEVLEFSLSFYEDLKQIHQSSNEDNYLSDVGNCAYVLLWNLAIAVEQGKKYKGGSDRYLPTLIRTWSIKLLSLSPKDLPAVTAKFRVSLEHIPTPRPTEERGKRNNDEAKFSDDSTMVQNVKEMFQEVLHNVRNTHMKVQQDLKTESCIDIFVHYFKYLWVFGHVEDSQTTLEQARNYLGSETDLYSDLNINSMLEGCALLFELHNTVIQFKVESAARMKNVLYKNSLSVKIKACRESIDAIVNFSHSEKASKLLSGVATTCSLCVDCLSRTASPCKPEMKALIHSDLMDIFELQSKVSDLEKHTWIQKGHQHLENLEKRRLEAVSLDAITSKCNRIDLLVKKVSLAEGVKKQLMASTVRQCLEEMDHTKKRILSEIRDPVIRLPKRMCLELGNLSYQAGKACYNQAWHAESADFLKNCNDLYVTWFKVSSKEERQSHLSSAKLWQKGFELLFESQRRSGQVKESMETLIRGIQTDENNLSSVAKCWAKLKYDVFVKTDSSPLINRTIYEEVQDMNIVFHDLTSVQILEAELKAYKEYRGQVPKAQVAVVDLLLRESTDDFDRAVALLEKARLVWTTRSDGVSSKTAVSFCVDALKLLTAEEKNTSRILDLQAYAHTLMYVIHSVDPLTFQDLSIARTKRREQIMKKKGILTNVDTVEDSETFEDCCTIGVEKESLANVKRALSLWKMIPVEDVWTLRDPCLTIDMLSVVASVCQLAKLATSQIRSLFIVSEFALKLKENTKYLTAQTTLIEAFTGLKQPHHANQLIRTTDAWIKTGKLESLKQTLHYIFYLAAKSGALFITGKLTESHKMLIEAIALKKKICGSNKTKENLMIESVLCLLEYRFLDLPPTVWTQPKTEIKDPFSTIETAFENILRGSRAISSVISFSLGSWVISEYKPERECRAPDNALQKWHLLNRLLPALLAAGEYCAQIGEPREAKCYLGQGLFIAQGFNLPRWFAAFHLSKATLENKRGSFNDVQAHLHRVKFVLSSDSVLQTQHLSSETSDDGLNESDDFIRSKAIDLEETVNHSDDMFESPSSPVCKKEPTFSVPEYWNHHPDCTCPCCTDAILTRNNIMSLIVAAELFIQQGSMAKAESVLTAVLEKFDILTNKTLVHIGSSSSLIAPCDKMVPSVFQDLLLQVCLQLISIAVHDNNRALFNEWYQKTKDLINTKTYPWMYNHQAALATLLYLEASFDRDTDCEDEDLNMESDISKLCVDISQIKLTGMNTNNFKTPYIGRGNIKKAQSESDLTSEEKSTKCKVDMKKAGSVYGINHSPMDVEQNKTTFKIMSKQDQIDTPDTSHEVPKAPTKQRKITSSRSSTRSRHTPTDTDDSSTKKEIQPKTQSRTKRGTKAAVKSPSESLTLHIECDATPRRTSARNVLKTPMSVCSNRRAVLDMLIDSEDESTDAKKRTGRKTSAKPTVAKSARATATRGRGRAKKKVAEDIPETEHLVTPGRKSKLPIPALNILDVNDVLSPNTRTPVFSEFSKKPLQNKSTDIYDFDTDKEGNTPKTRNTVTKSRRGRGKKVDALETSRPEQSVDTPGIDIYDFPNECTTDSQGTANTKPKRGGKGRKKATKNEAIEIRRYNPKSAAETQSLLEIEEVEEEDLEEEDAPLLGNVSEENKNESKARKSDSEPVELARYDTDSEEEAPCSALQRQIIMKRRRRSGGRGMIDLPVFENKENFEPVTDATVIKPTVTVNVWREDNAVNDLTKSDERSFEALKVAYNTLSHNPPTPIYRQTCQALAKILLSKAAYKEAAFYFSEAQNSTFRHIALMNLGRKLRKMDESPSNGSDSQLRKKLLSARESLQFGKSLNDFQKILDSLHKDWTVCHASVVQAHDKSAPTLYMTRYRRGQEALTCKLRGFSTERGQKMLKEFSTIMKVNTDTMSLSDKSDWWSERTLLDAKLKALLLDIENQWLGCWRGTLMGSLSNSTDAENLDKSVTELSTSMSLKKDTERNILRVLIQSCHLLTERELFDGSRTLFNTTKIAELQDKVFQIRRVSKSLNIDNSDRYPVVLILDKTIQHLPFESLPVLINHQVTRAPSLPYLHTHATMASSDPNSLLNTGVDLRKVYYVLNPGQDLPSTEKQFREWFERERGWSGITGVAPANSHMSQALTENDLYVYCGHGSGSKFLSSNHLQGMHCRAAALIMGCSSGKLVASGQLEACGTMLSYFLAGCPCVVANLWDVTDRDIDRFATHLLESWIAEKKSVSILTHMSPSRRVCRLPYLVGAAPVVYGLPIAIKPQSTN